LDNYAKDTPMNINSRTQLYGVLGNPVEHSLSPVIHNAAFRRYDLNAQYLAFCVRPEALGLAFEGVRALDIRGVNLTIPFKQTAIEFVDEIPEDVDRACGAINTVVNKEGQLLGYNTDGMGFLTSLKEDLSFNPDGKNILVLGAGGSACSIVFSLAWAHAQCVFIYNRTPERAYGLASFAGTYFPETDIEALAGLQDLGLQKVDLVVNTTSCGMAGNTDVPLDLKLLKKEAAIYDLVYSPSETPLLKSARTLGWSSVNGLGMLAAQAALSFELWTGKKDGVRETMREVLQTCHR
jgi:shikimate dehydrogenase